METEPFRALGHRVTEFTGLETFPRPSGIRRVECESDEVTALCPVTGQPDQYTVKIVYYPRTVCVESKSLKLYLQSFRNEGLFVESFAARVAEDIATALSCEASATIVQKPRGGISITAHASREMHPVGEDDEATWEVDL